ncbi:MAG: PolC-type DNA polymerase III, partial [Clostridiales bacterium]|nr:PolC-type DNA polymerase III [Candidatus Apopatocola equi]
ESSTVTVEGSVFAVDSREVRSGAAVLSFTMTDYTGSIHVSRYFKKDEDKTVIDKIKPGMWLVVHGHMSFNRYDNDIALEPVAIAEGVQEKRKDEYEGEKRVELHLHTRYSALDALTDPTAAVKTAAKWGHKAIAITDHGVAQAFPEMWHAADKAGIKIIYGVEGYFINDVDDLLTVSRESELPLRCEFVAFDIETTGLDGGKDHITEIGAVHFSAEGRVLRSFQTFVNPGIPIPPEIVNLTGITDQDVFGAPTEATAVAQFLEFCGERVVVAHNAQFDVGFIRRVAEANGSSFDPVFIDTLPMAQSLLPELKRHKLDNVSRALGLPDFNHHRASDDAAVCGNIYLTLLQRVEDHGGTLLNDVESFCKEANRGNDNRRVRHIIILTRTKPGLKNLYELISKSHLEHFKRNPIIPKSLLMQYREGLIIGSACEAGELFDAVLSRRSDTELERLAFFYDFLEIQPLCNNHFLLDEGKVDSEEDLRDLNRRIVALAKKLNKPFCATGDVHFLDPEDEIYRHILLASKKFADADKSLPIYFKTTDEMMEEFAYLGEEDCYAAVIGHPNAIAESVDTFELLPPDLYPPSIPHAAEDLEQMCWDKTHELYGDDPPDIVRDRVQVELDAILGRHYEVIYMSAQKLVQNSLEHGYLVGSRGSVGSSMVAYMSGITEVNSLPPHYRCPNCRHSDFDPVYDSETGEKYGCGADMPDKNCPVCGTKMAKEGFDIPFETFLGFGGDKVPDIDLSFSGEYQANAHKYTEELFGRDHVFRAG